MPTGFTKDKGPFSKKKKKLDVFSRTKKESKDKSISTMNYRKEETKVLVIKFICETNLPNS
jgi:hypothetical protein